MQSTRQSGREWEAHVTFPCSLGHGCLCLLESHCWACQHRAWLGVRIPNMQGLGNEGVEINKIPYEISLLGPGERLSQSKRYFSDLPPRRGAPRTGTPGQPRMATGRAEACCLGWRAHSSRPTRATNSEWGPRWGLQLPLQLTPGLGCSATRDCFRNKRGKRKKHPAQGGTSTAKQAGPGIICSPYANLLCHCLAIFRSHWRI